MHGYDDVYDNQVAVNGKQVGPSVFSRCVNIPAPQHTHAGCDLQDDGDNVDKDGCGLKTYFLGL